MEPCRDVTFYLLLHHLRRARDGQGTGADEGIHQTEDQIIAAEMSARDGGPELGQALLEAAQQGGL